MKKFFIMILCFCCSAPAFSSEVYDFNDWNTASKIVQSIQRPNIPDEEYRVETINDDFRKNIQEIIDKVSESGGGKIIIPEGEYFCKGTIILKSCVEIHLEEGAKILFSPEPSDYLPVVKTRWEGTELMNYSPMIYAYGQHDIALTGKGIIDGNAESVFHSWKKLEKPSQLQLRRLGASGFPLEKRIFGEGYYLRPCMIEINYCEKVLLEDYTAVNSPFWVNHINCSNHVQVRRLKVNSNFPNNDGVDIESCQYVLVEENIFRTGDDSIAVKSGRDYDGRKIGLPSKYVVIRKNDMAGDDGIVLGSELSGGISYIFFEDNILRNGLCALRFKTNLNRGGICEHIRIRNMKIDDYKNFIWFQLNYPEELGSNFPTVCKDFVFENITVENLKGILFECRASEGYPLQDVILRNITVKKSERNYFELENISNLVIDNFNVNGQKINGTLSSF